MTRTSFSFKQLVLASLLTGATAVAMAQPAPAPAGDAAARHEQGPRHRPDPAKMQAHMAERQAALKTRLNITADQEPAWSSFIASMQPVARTQPPERQALRKMTTPERIELLRARQAERTAAMDRRAEATLRLYAALTPEQQQLFDARGGVGHPHHGPHGMPAKG